MPQLRSADGRSRSRNLDMDTNNFLVEAVFRTKPVHTGGWLVSKLDTAGYALDIDNTGRVRMRILAGGTERILAHVPGSRQLTANGITSSRKWTALHRKAFAFTSTGNKPAASLSGRRPAPNASLTNTADFLVGKGPAGISSLGR